jgi:hypothetical protein
VADLDLDGLTLVAVVVLEDSVFERIASLPALAGEKPQPKAKSPAGPGFFKERKPLRSLRLGSRLLDGRGCELQIGTDVLDLHLDRGRF